MLRVFRLSCLIGAAAMLMGAVALRDDNPPPDALRQLYAGAPASWPRPMLHDGAVFEEFGALAPRPKLEGREAALAALGEKLFNEPGLSGSGQIACASCHNRELGFGDGLRTSFGHDRKRGTRNAQPLFTAAWMHELFWDGRAPSLEAQSHLPIENPVEMAGEIAAAERWVNRQPGYRAEFEAVFGTGRIDIDHVASALGAFQRTLRPPRSKWDRMLEAGPQAFTDQELLGLHLFRTKAGCANCHNGPLFSDQRYHNLQISFYGRRLEDLGRYTVTKDPVDVGRFRTPSLRAVRRTGPFMHNGIFPTLVGVVNMYNGGGGRDRQTPSEISPGVPVPQPDPLLKRLDLTGEERAALVAFLETL